jgi:hypothetical protein
MVAPLIHLILPPILPATIRILKHAAIRTYNVIIVTKDYWTQPRFVSLLTSQAVWDI